MDNLDRFLRQFKPMLALINNLGFLRINRDPNPEPSAGDPPAGDPQPNEFFNSLSEENRKPNEEGGTATLSKFKTADELGKSYVELEGKMGQKGILVPKEGASPEEIDTFHNSLGRPEKAEGYTMTAIENLHESIKVTPESQAGYNQICHGLGFTNKQADGMNGFLLGVVNQVAINNAKAEQDAVDAAMTTLRGEWKENFDTTKALSIDVTKKIVGEEGINAMGGPEGLGNNPTFLKLMGKIAPLLSEDQISNLVTGPGSQPAGTETKEEAKSKAMDMQNNKENEWYKALNDETDSKHKAAVAEKDRLYQIAYGSGAVA